MDGLNEKIYIKNHNNGAIFTMEILNEI